MTRIEQIAQDIISDINAAYPDGKVWEAKYIIVKTDLVKQLREQLKELYKNTDENEEPTF